VVHGEDGAPHAAGSRSGSKPVDPRPGAAGTGPRGSGDGSSVPRTSTHIPERLEGTLNDVRITRTCEYPLEQVRVPVLVIHGTADRFVPFEQHGKVLATRILGAELVAAEGGDHVAIYTHRSMIRPRVVRFLYEHAHHAAGK